MGLLIRVGVQNEYAEHLNLRITHLKATIQKVEYIFLELSLW